MKKVKGLSTEKDRLIQTYLSSEKLRVLMKQAKADLFVEELVGFLVLFLLAVGLIGITALLLMWLNAVLRVTT